MVIFLPAQLEKTTRVNHVAQRVPDSQLLIPKKMSKGTTLFSCGLMDSEAWGELSRRCPFQSEPPGASLDSLWDAMPVTCQEGSAWSRETGPCSLSSLIQDLSLSDTKGSQTTAPPSKRQCRSLSLSEELNSCRTAWRPIGSRIWTPVEKRRCHSGGSVQRCSNGFSGITMQRSSSFSLPARSNTFPGTFPRVCDQVCIPQDFGSQTFHGFQESSTITGSGAEREELEPQRSLSLSHEQISTSDYQSPSARSTPDSTPELERRVRSGGLSRSRSQPCVLNDKKIGMKRRRPEEVLEQRPSLDLAKMTQNLGTFPNITGHSCSQLLATNGRTRQSDLDTAFSSDTGHKVALPQSCENGKEEDSKQELQYSPADGGNYKQAISHMDEVESWDSQKNVFQLGGELDIEQIERN